MNAIGYTRISVQQQSDYSLENQERVIKQYCVNNNLTLLDTFKDDGESSYTFDRPDWIKLESFIRKNKDVQFLIVANHDRFSRNLAEALLKIKELYDKFGIKVIATSDSINTDFTDPSTFMIRAFQYMMAESELHRIRQRTKAGMLQGALNGRFLNKAPYGYINKRDDQGTPVIVKDEEKCFIVNIIFKEYNRGMDIEQIRTLVKTYGFEQKGNSAIQDILKNPVYAGLIKVPALKGKPETVTKGIHESVITEQEYWAARERLERKTKKTSAIQKREEVPLRGVLKCECGRFMTAGNSKGRKKYYWYYLCPVHRKHFPAKILHEKLNELLDLLSFSQERIDWFVEKLSEEISIHLNQRGEIIAKAKKALRTVNEKIIATEEKYLEDLSINKATYSRIMNSHKAKRSALEERMSELSLDQNIYWQKLNELLPQIHDIRATYEGLDLQRKQQFLLLVFDNSLSVKNNIYRTAQLHPMFAHNINILKQKKLLEIIPVISKSLALRNVPRSGTVSNPIAFIMKLADLLLAA